MGKCWNGFQIRVLESEVVDVGRLYVAFRSLRWSRSRSGRRARPRASEKLLEGSNGGLWCGAESKGRANCYGVWSC